MEKRGFVNIFFELVHPQFFIRSIDPAKPPFKPLGRGLSDREGNNRTSDSGGVVPW